MAFATIMICVFLLAFATVSWGKGPAGVASTVHNLSATSGAFVYRTNTTEICVFCHTPHGGSLKGPLWNHDLPDAASFTHYNSASLSLSGLGYTSNRVIGDESLLCMSCHDGSVALDHLINDPNSLGGADIVFSFGPTNDLFMGDLFSSPGARIGASPSDTAGTGDLTDDHPISFSYSDVIAQAMYQAGGSKDGELRAIGSTGDPATALGWKGEGVRFFGTDYRVECSSCHDPHVNYDINLDPGNADAAYKPFLIRPNAASDLCLACHNK